MEQIYVIVGNFLLERPQLLAFLVAFLTAVKIITVVVDALVSSRAEWDKTPLTNDNWHERAFAVVVRGVQFLGKIAAALSGFRPKAKDEIIIEEKK